MKSIFTLVLLLFFSTAFSQWSRVQQLPSTDIFSIYKKGSVLYVGGKNLVYISRDKGITWDSTKTIPAFSLLDNIIIYKNELYASSYSVGIYKSSDEGNTWQNVTAGLFPFVSDLCEWNGDLYAATLGGSVFKLDPLRRNNWSPFSIGLSSLSANLTSIAGTSNTLVAGTIANALYDYLPSTGSTIWNELFLLGQLHPNEGTYDIITAHDSLFLAGHTGSFYMSLNGGHDWNRFGSVLSSTFNSLLNAKQALLLSQDNFDGVNNNTSFYYIKKDSLQSSFVSFSFLNHHYSYGLEIIGNKLWNASSEGLFYMSLSELPGITGVDDTIANSPLPVRFTSFTVNCGDNRILISWKTAQEQNSSRFDIEESVDGNSWNVIGSLPAAGNSSTETGYSFTKNNPAQNYFYRIAEYDLDGRVNYTGIARSSCDSTYPFRFWPNPVRDNVFIDLNANNQSPAILKLFDSKGALVKEQRTVLMQGRNQVEMNLSSLSSGSYQLQINWNNGQTKKTISIMKL